MSFRLINQPEHGLHAQESEPLPERHCYVHVEPAVYLHHKPGAGDAECIAANEVEPPVRTIRSAFLETDRAGQIQEDKAQQG